MLSLALAGEVATSSLLIRSNVLADDFTEQCLGSEVGCMITHAEIADGCLTRQHTVARCRDLQGYVVLCGVSTFGSLITTVLSLTIPQSFWQRLETEGVLSVWKQVLLGLTSRAQSIAQRYRNSVHSARCTGSHQVAPADGCVPGRSTRCRSSRGSAGGDTGPAAVSVLVVPEATPASL